MSNRAVHNLPRLRFSSEKFGTLPEVPTGPIETSWENGLAPRRFPYVPGAAHEDVEREELFANTELYFINTYQPGLYPGVWATWRKALLSGAIGELTHPDIGVFSARVKGGSYVIAPNVQGGVKVRVSFVESLPSADQPTALEFAEGNAQEVAQIVDESMAAMGIEYPSGYPEVSLEEFVSAIVSFGPLLAAEFVAKAEYMVGTIDRIQAQIDENVEFASSSIEQDLDSIANNPSRSILERALNDLRWIMTQQIKAAGALSRVVKTYTTSSTLTLAAISIALKADIAGIVQLNPKLLSLPSLSPGTQVRYFAAA
ncbi:MAG: hypothetical protein HOW73_47535 [Polyangiaceae bacterium]|nr:hypothetical protein [Polyangiaceae bacterium]